MAQPRGFSGGAKFLLQTTIDLSNIAAQAESDQTVTVTGASLGDSVIVRAPALEAGLGITNAHVSAASTVKFRVFNYSAGAVDAASQSFEIVVF